MEDFLYPYNQPKQFGKYDLFLDGKIVANEVVTKSGSVGGEGMTEEERQTLVGAAQKNSDNTFSANNTFTGTLDISNAQIVTPDDWNVGELTAEQVQAVVPLKWNNERVVFGEGAISEGRGVSLGKGSIAYGSFSVAAGFKATAYHQSVGIGGNITSEMNSVGVGRDAYSAQGSVACGYAAKSNKPTTVTLGAYFSDTEGTHTCTTEGTGSITIGAGANTLNTTTADGSVTESSNAVTIGCKAKNQGADSVVIGAQASGTSNSVNNNGGVTIGAGASNSGSAVVIGRAASVPYGVGVSIGANSQTSSIGCVSVGDTAKSSYYGTAIGHWSDAKDEGVALGCGAKSLQTAAIAIGNYAKAANKGVVVIASYSEANFRDYTRTQLYFSGANTPLAIEYEGGEAMMGYVVTDKAGNKLAAGTQKLSVLFPNNSTFQPATVDENGEWVMPKVFHPSDLDLPVEEPIEPEEYQPLPVYPIVEPEIEEYIQE